MKRLRTPLLTGALLLLSTPPATAQITFSMLGGVNIASLDVSARDIIEDTVALRRMSVGLALSLPVGGALGLQLGASMAQKGGSVFVRDSAGSNESHIRANYFEVTALGRLGIPLLGSFVSAHLVGGPALGIETSCDVLLFFDRGGVDAEESEDCSEERDRNDYGLAAGGGVDIWLSGMLGISLGVLYTRGLADLNTTEDTSGTRTRTLTLRGGLVLSLG